MRAAVRERQRIDAVQVVVPAHDEELLLPRHLSSLQTAVAALRRSRPAVRVQARVVLDSCTDRSADVVAAHPGIEAVTTRSGVVGEVRACGIERVRASLSGVDPTAVWVACTDADTVVPPGWLVGQVELAEQGHQLVVGTVHPDPDDLAPAVLSAWLRRHRLVEGHAHVHGANLGFTLAAHDAVGGFAPLTSGEDVDLVRRMQAHGVRWHATARTQVLTSGRRTARAPAGFAAYLLGLGSQVS